MKRFFQSILNPEVKPFQIVYALLFLRLFAGGLMLTHGYPKLMKLLEGNTSFADPLGLGSEISLALAVLAEFIGALFIMFGFLTRIASFMLGFTMFVAAFIQHFEDPFARKEKALLYFAMYLVLWVSGPGRLSVDNQISSFKK